MKLHALCGYASIYEYMERVLGYGPHAAHERMRVARSVAKLPETTSALARGELSYSAVRELTRVATDETETDWLAAANGLAISQIERLVAGHQPGDPAHPAVVAALADDVLHRAFHSAGAQLEIQLDDLVVGHLVEPILQVANHAEPR